MEVVELEALDERAVEHRGRGCAGGLPGADDHGVAASLQPKDRVGGDSRPGQLGTDQGATQTVEEQIFRPFDHGVRDVVESEVGDPGRQTPGRARRICGGLLLYRGHRISPKLISCYIHITTDPRAQGRRCGNMTTVGETSAKAGQVSTVSGVPLHRQLYLVLHDEIDRGVVAPGDALPTEQTLCDQFGVSRITVRRALSDLAEQGYIERRQGVGSFVRDHGRTEESPAGRSYLEGLRQTQFETEVDVVELDPRRPPALVAEALGAAGDLLHIVRVRRQRRTGEPLMVTDAWLPAELADTFTESALRRTPLYELLSAAEITVDCVRHEITAEIAGPRNAQLLDTPIGAALLRVNRLAYVAGEQNNQL